MVMGEDQTRVGDLHGHMLNIICYNAVVVYELTRGNTDIVKGSESIKE